MKLSKAQQRVVGLMKQGWELKSARGFDPFAWLRLPETLHTKTVSISTLHALLDRKVIVISKETWRSCNYELNPNQK